MGSRPVLRTALCDLLGIEYPVVAAPLGPLVGGDHRGVSGPELVAAVSNAGGLGVLGAAGLPPDALEGEIREVRERTDRPFGVGLLLPTLPAGGPPSTDELDAQIPDATRAAVERLRAQLQLPLVPRRQRTASVPPAVYDPGAQIEVVTRLRVPVLTTGLGDPARYVARVREAGTRVLAAVGSPGAAQRALAAGVDALVAVGHEAGGVPGRMGTLALVPAVLDRAGPVPVLAGGGIGDGDALAAMLAMGAAGGWCGTIFAATIEARLDDVRKQQIVDATGESTVVTALYSGVPVRAVRNPLIDAWEAAGIDAAGPGVQTVLVAGLLKGAENAGRVDYQMNPAGQVAGRVDAIRPAADVVARLVEAAARRLAVGIGAQVTAAP